MNLNGNGDLIPSSFVSRVLLSVASQGSLLTLPAPFPNSSYAVEFYGPTISCGDPKNETFTRRVGELIEYKYPLAGANTFVYVGFVPSFRGSQLLANATNEEKALNALWWTMGSSVVSRLNYLDQLVGMKGAVTFYVAVPGKSPFQAEKPIVCQLYNSSYALNYTFSNGQQHVQYETKEINTVGSMNGKRCDIKDPNLCSASHAYLSLMGAMGHFVRGTLFRNGLGGIDPKETQIKSSVSMETKELQALNEDTSYSSIGNIYMADALEELFLNFTISLFSNQKFV